MPFRGHDADEAEFLRDSLERFIALDEAMEHSRRTLTDRMPQRFAAVNSIHVPGEPEAIAQTLREYSARLRARMTMPFAFVAAMDVLFASVLLRHGDDPDALLDEFERVRPRMRARRLRWAPVYEFIAVLALRLLGQGKAIEDEHLDRMRATYKAMKANHWWLTGPDDFPMCALMATRPGEPKLLADRAHAIYQALRRDAGTYRGEMLQTASNTLSLSALEPDELSARFAALMEGFDGAGLRMQVDNYDELAALCFIARPLDSIIRCVADFEAAIRAHVRWYERFSSFNWAANLAFMRFVGLDPSLGPVADIKALMDMQWILAQRG